MLFFSLMMNSIPYLFSPDQPHASPPAEHFKLFIFVRMVYNKIYLILSMRRIFTMARGGFPGIPGGNMQQLMRQAQKMQQQMMKAQEDLDAREYEGTAGGGAVSCKVSGKRQLLSLTIDKDAVDPEEVEMLQDMIVAAVNDALKKGEETRESEMAKIGGAAGMGGLF